MAGSIQNTIMVFKPETTSGTSSAPTVAADAVLVWVDDLDVKIEQKMAPRNIVVGAFGAADSLPYARRGLVTFTTDLQASGTLGTAPPWGDIALCAGFAETVTATTRVDYSLTSSGIKTATIAVEYNDRLLTLVYCSVDLVGIVLEAGGVPRLKWQARGLVSTSVAAQLGSPTLSSWIRPEAVSTATTTKVSIGAVTLSAGALAGGSLYTFKSLNIALGNDIQSPDLVGVETVGIYGRNATAELVLDGGAAAHVAWEADMNAGTARAFGLVHGSVAGKKVIVYASNGVLTEVGDSKDGNVLYDSLKFSLPPKVGNDELALCCI